MVKLFVLYGSILLGTITHTGAQAMEKYTITFVAEIPVIIESGLYLNKLSKDQAFTTISGKIKLALAPRGVAILSDQYFQISKPIKKEKLSGIEYRFFLNHPSNNRWMPLDFAQKNITSFPYGGLLVDTLLKANEKLVLQFRYKGDGKIIQQLSFVRPELLPVVTDFKMQNQHDSVDNKIRTKGIEAIKKQIPGFHPLTEDKISILAGKHVELLIKNLSFNKDSCILYRLRQANKRAADWKRTGHLLAIQEIKAGKEYWLDIRYVDMTAFNTYQLVALPFWYQRSWAIATFSLLGLAALIGVPYSFYKYRLGKERQKQERLQEQLKTVQSQLNPHFVYNALSSIEGLVTNKENDRANEYLASFSDIMRDTLKNSNVLFISLAQDIEMLEKYIAIEQLRFEFKYILSIDPDLDLEAIEFPPMLLQPSVENAVKHGVAGMGSAGTITLIFSKTGSNLEIMIEDNGSGYQPKDNRKSGYGIKFTRERIDKLKKLYRSENIKYDLIYTDHGTKAYFFFENWLQS